MNKAKRHRFGKIDHPLDRHSEIVDELTRDIVSGVYKPSGRLPRWRDLAAQYDTSLATVRKALDRLEDHGFIERGGWHGVRVVDNLPNLGHFGLVFPEPGNSESRYSSNFWTTLASVAGQLRETRHRWMSVYSGVAQNPGPLAADLNARRLAGLILAERYAAEIPSFADLVVSAQVPLVALLTEVNLPGVTRVLLPPDDFMDRACSYFSKMGRKRMALVSVVNAGQTMWEAAQPALAAHGMVTRPWWRMDVTPHYPDALRPLMQMLWRLPAKDRPDALVISDDNLVPAATAGLAAAGVRVPRGLAVVAHANFPKPTSSALPVVRLGFDVRRVVAACLDVLGRRALGETVNDPVRVPAEFEDDIVK